MSGDNAGDVGQKIRAERKAKGWTQEVLAAKAGVARTTLADYERGYHHPTEQNLTRLAAALNREVSYFGSPWDPEGPRQKRRLKETEQVADSSAVTNNADVASTMERLMTLPDPELFAKILAEWQTLDTHAERRGMLDYVRGYKSFMAQAGRRKNNRR